jgi:hypothetical protein
MDYISFMLLTIDKKKTNYQEKERNKKVHKMHKSMVTILSNFNTAMCDAFIKD